MASSIQHADPSAAPRSLEEVRALYQPNAEYRISPYAYQVGTRFEGCGRSCTVHVLAGSCEFKFEGMSVALSMGQRASIPSGDYIFEVVGPTSVELVYIWHLPPLFGGDA